MVAFSSSSWCWTPLLLSCMASSAQALYIPNAALIISNINNVVDSSNKTDKIAQAWYTSWNTDVLPLDNVSWSKYTHLTYAFA
jgi:chitinase